MSAGSLFDRSTGFPPNPALSHIHPDAIEIDVDTHSGDWDSAFDNAEALIEAAIEAALEAGLQEISQNAEGGFSPAEFSVILSDNATVHELNRDYRGKDKPTNVLSFALADEETPENVAQLAPAPISLGEIIIALETVLAEAEQQEKQPDHYLTHLCVHGVLHLLGFDHISDAEAAHMEQLETKILTSMGHPAPYENSDVRLG